MPYGMTDLTQVMGIGSYVGEIREGPDGQLYEWVEGVDGLGNPIGFWRVFKRIGRGIARAARGALRFVRPFARFALPFAKFIPGVGPAIYAGGMLAQRAGLLGTGQIAEGPNGQLYEYVEGVDGLGNPIGFWRQLRRAAGGLLRRALPIARGLIPGAAAGGLIPGAAQLLRGGLPGGLPGVVGGLLRRMPGFQRIRRITGRFCQALPQLEPCIRQIPEAQRPYEISTRVCNALRRVGLAGVEDGLMEAPDGQLYEVVEGIGAFGERRRFLRRVSLCLPATIRPRVLIRRPVRPGIPAPPAIPGVRPPVPMPGVRAFRRFR